MVQGELFTEDSADVRSNQVASFFSRNQLVIGYDKLLLLLIVFIVLFILTYSFGYERGYKAAERKIQSLTAHIETLTAEPATPAESVINVASPNQATSVQIPQSSITNVNSELVAESVDESQKPLEDESVVPKGKYTIQISTVLSKERAEKEIQKLSAKVGSLKPFYLKRGKYFEICAGSFDTVLTAKPTLSEFKTKNISADAFVRPLT